MIPSFLQSHFGPAFCLGQFSGVTFGHHRTFESATLMIKDLHLIGLNHKTAPLDLREDYLRQLGELPQALEKLKSKTRECAILSTCNRFEIIYINDSTLELNDLIDGDVHKFIVESRSFIRSQTDRHDEFLAGNTTSPALAYTV